jgi:hypothetical protein
VERKRRPEPGISICGLSLSAQQLIFLIQKRKEEKKPKGQEIKRVEKVEKV